MNRARKWLALVVSTFVVGIASAAIAAPNLDTGQANDQKIAQEKLTATIATDKDVGTAEKQEVGSLTACDKAVALETARYNVANRTIEMIEATQEPTTLTTANDTGPARTLTPMVVAEIEKEYTSGIDAKKTGTIEATARDAVTSTESTPFSASARNDGDNCPATPANTGPTATASAPSINHGTIDTGPTTGS